MPALPVNASHSHRFIPFLAVAASWQLLTTLIASIFSHSFTPATAAQAPKYIFDYMLHWDAQWYLSIINGSYSDPDSFSPAFFPLFPLVMWLARTMTFGLVDITLLSLVLNTILLAISLYFLSKISLHFLPNVSKWVLPCIFLLSPVAVFQNFFYTEALFCSLTFSAYYFALKQKWFVMAILLLLVTATRLPGILVVGLCGLEYLRVHSWSVSASLRNKDVLWFFATPLGVVCYSIYLEVVRHDFLAMLHSQRLWSYHEFNINIFETIYRSFHVIAHNLIHANEVGYVLVVSQILPLLSLATLAIASVYLLMKRISIPLGAYGLTAFVFFTLNSNVVSVHRYMLGILTIHIALLFLYSSKQRFAKPVFFACIYVSVLLQSFLLFLFSTNYFAG